MSQLWGRLLGRPETLLTFEADDADDAPDEYFRAFLCKLEGAVAFIEVSETQDGPWQLWRVECVYLNPLMLLTGKRTLLEAQTELSKEHEP